MSEIGVRLKVLGAVAGLLLLGAGCGGDDRAKPLVPEYIPDGMVVKGSSWSEPGVRERDSTIPEWITVVPTGVADPFDGPTLSLRRDSGHTYESPSGEVTVDLGGVGAAVWQGPSQHMVSWVQDGSLLTLTGRWVDEELVVDVARSMVRAADDSSPAVWVPDGWEVADVADIVDGHSGGSLELGTLTAPERSINIAWNAGGASLFDFFRASAPAPSSCIDQSLAACDVTFEIDGRPALDIGSGGGSLSSGITMWVASDGRFAQAYGSGLPRADFLRVIESVRTSSWDAVDELSTRTQATAVPTSDSMSSLTDP